MLPKKSASLVLLIGLMACQSATVEIKVKATHNYYKTTSSEDGSQTSLDLSKKYKAAIRYAKVSVLDSSGHEIYSSFTDGDGRAVIQTQGDFRVRVYSEFSHEATAKNDSDCWSKGWKYNIKDNGADNQSHFIQSGMISDIQEGKVLVLNAGLAITEDGSSTNRAGSPFAVGRSILAGHSYLCQRYPEKVLDPLSVFYSPLNSSVDNALTNYIGTSFFRTQGSERQLYILGDMETDSDEFDEHVILHEYGHFVESQFWRRDTPGGQHKLGDLLHPSLAFSEGFASFFAGIVLGDPIYKDTALDGGFIFDMVADLETDDKSMYSEFSVAYFLTGLGQDKDWNARLFAGLKEVLPNTKLLINLFPLASHMRGLYNYEKIDSDLLDEYWSASDHLDQSLNALCPGVCQKSSESLLYDKDNDLGIHYSTTRHFPQSDSDFKSAEFWQMFRPLTSGVLSVTDFETLDPGTGQAGHEAYPANKFGMTRHYILTGDGNSHDIILNHIVVSSAPACNSSSLSMSIWKDGKTLALADYEKNVGNCFALRSFKTQNKATYLVVIKGKTSAVEGWQLELQ